MKKKYPGKFFDWVVVPIVIAGTVFVLLHFIVWGGMA